MVPSTNNFIHESIYTHMKYKEYVGDIDNLVIDWTVSSICNYDCSYCSPASKNGKYSWPEIESVRTTIKKLLQSNSEKRITYALSGGELTLWKQFPDFVAMLREETPGCVIKLLTNGIMPESYWEKNGILFDRIQFSYHMLPFHANLDRFMDSVNSSSSPVNFVFVLAPPNIFRESMYAYQQILDNCEDVTLIIAKPIDDRASDSIGLVKYTQEQLDWINSSMVSKNLDKIDLDTYSKFVGIREDGSEDHYLEPMKLMVSGETHWKGWTCSIGVEKKTFKVDGSIVRGSSCKAGSIMGNWRNGEIYEDNVSPIICPYDGCFCASDITVSRKYIPIKSTL